VTLQLVSAKTLAQKQGLAGSAGIVTILSAKDVKMD